jgi:hypothetical protein
MDRFTNQRNIERYRRLASAATNRKERLELIDLLAAEFRQEFRERVVACGPYYRAARQEGAEPVSQ